jgi:hypothetical protein
MVLLHPPTFQKKTLKPFSTPTRWVISTPRQLKGKSILKPIEKIFTPKRMIKKKAAQECAAV